jgi:DivIVA domain-containing protein
MEVGCPRGGGRSVRRYDGRRRVVRPPQGVWSHLKRSIGNLAVTGVDHLLAIIKNRLKVLGEVPLPPYVTVEDVGFAVRAVVVHAAVDGPAGGGVSLRRMGVPVSVAAVGSAGAGRAWPGAGGGRRADPRRRPGGRAGCGGRGCAMIYRSSGRLAPYQVRARLFGTRWRGLDPEQVYAYLGQVADELARLERGATTSRTETERLKQGLRQWQARHVGCRFTDPVWPPYRNRGPR